MSWNKPKWTPDKKTKSLNANKPTAETHVSCDTWQLSLNLVSHECLCTWLFLLRTCLTPFLSSFFFFFGLGGVWINKKEKHFGFDDLSTCKFVTPMYHWPNPGKERNRIECVMGWKYAFALEGKPFAFTRTGFQNVYEHLHMGQGPKNLLLCYFL